MAVVAGKPLHRPSFSRSDCVALADDLRLYFDCQCNGARSCKNNELLARVRAQAHCKRGVLSIADKF